MCFQGWHKLFATVPKKAHATAFKKMQDLEQVQKDAHFNVYEPEKHTVDRWELLLKYLYFEVLHTYQCHFRTHKQDKSTCLEKSMGQLIYMHEDHTIVMLNIHDRANRRVTLQRDWVQQCTNTRQRKLVQAYICFWFSAQGRKKSTEKCSFQPCTRQNTWESVPHPKT